MLAKNKPITICGSSMGAYVALTLLKTQNVNNLILFCPAIYDTRAFSVQFDKDFTEIIRQKESWKNSNIVPALKKFKGDLLIIIGNDDKIIPKEVITLLDKSATNAMKKELIIIPDCPHKIHSWLSKHKDTADKIAEKISELKPY